MSKQVSYRKQYAISLIDASLFDPLASSFTTFMDPLVNIELVSLR